MKARNIIYSLKSDVNNKSILSIDLTARILSENTEYIVIDLPTGKTEIKKHDYLNRLKIYEVDAKLFFLICDKKVDRDYAFNCLMKYALQKVDNRINNLLSIKQKLQLEMVA